MKPALVLFALAASLSGRAQQIQVSQANRTIAVTTSDSASALADTAIVSVGFVAYGKDQNATYADASKTSNAIVAALVAAGVSRTAIASVDQDLSPLDTNSDSDKARLAAGLRFAFKQHWRVTVPADQAAAVLHIAVLNGASDSGAVEWQLLQEGA